MNIKKFKLFIPICLIFVIIIGVFIYCVTIHQDSLLEKGTKEENLLDGTDKKDEVDEKILNFKVEKDELYVSYDNGENWNTVGSINSAEGETPDFKVEKDELYVSYDNGENWNTVGNIGSVEGETPNFKVEKDELYVSYDKGENWNTVGSIDGTSDTSENEAPTVEVPKTEVPVKEDIDLFVFAGQSNMMGATVLEPQVNTFTDKALEYKYMPKLRGQKTGNFVSAQNPAGEFYYKDLTAAYGKKLKDLSYKSTLANYSANAHFAPSMRNGVKSFASQSEANMYPAASLAPYFATEYAKYGHSSVYAHMAKGSVSITHFFTSEMMSKYNNLINAYNVANGTNYKKLSSVSGAGAAFDKKYKSMLEDYKIFAPNNNIKNKSFIWLQGEGDGSSSYIEYKLKMQVLWEHMQNLGFNHFFVLRVGYWGKPGIINVMKAQEDFCAETANCNIVTRAPSLIPYPGMTTDNWWINSPSVEYDNCRDSYLVSGNTNYHFNEKAFQLFAERSAKNIHRILYLGLDPILEEENVKGMLNIEEKPVEKPVEKPIEKPEDNSSYTSYIGTKTFCNALSISKPVNTWQEQASSAATTNLIAVKSTDSIWIQYVFIKSEAHAVGGFYDTNGKLVAPLYYKDFGFSLNGNTSGAAAFLTPEKNNRISIADVEAKTGKKIAYVRFTAWVSSTGGKANTEARIYHNEKDASTIYTSYLGSRDFYEKKSVSNVNSVWVEQANNTVSTTLIPVKSTDSVWIQYVFIKSEAHAVGGFYDQNKKLVAPLYYKDFGFSLNGNTSGTTAFLTPEKNNRISIADVEARTGKKIAYVRFTAWSASAGGYANTEARIYQ